MYQVQLAFRYTHTLCISRAGWWSSSVCSVHLLEDIHRIPPLRANPVQTPCISTYIYIVYILYPKGPSRLLFSSQKTHTHTHTLVLLSVYVHKLKYRSITAYTSRREKEERKAANGSQNVRQSSSRPEKKKRKRKTSLFRLFLSVEALEKLSRSLRK